MATVGFEKAYIGIMDATSEKIVDVHEINALEGGTIDAKISGLGATTNTVFASNVPFHVTAQGVSSPKVELGIADLSEEIYVAVTGAEINAEGITTIGSKTKPPYCSLILKSADKDGNELYFGFTKGKFTHDGYDLQTAEDKGVEMNTDSISADFIARGADEIVFAKGSTATDKFTAEAFKKFIMPTTAPIENED